MNAVDQIPQADNAFLCPNCEQGYLRAETHDYVERQPDGPTIIVPNVPMKVCDHCGEIAISLAAGRRIAAYVAEQNEELTPRDLERIRENLGVDQTEMSEALGLGGKTYHRWEKGHQSPSRSMGFYLRALAEFPEVFAWLRERRWRQENRLRPAAVNRREGELDLAAMFPDLPPADARPEATPPPRGVRPNPALALLGK